MFDQVAIRLLQGDFICEVSAPALYRYLRDSSHEVDALLRKLGRMLVTTPNQHAYYATWAKLGPDERSQAKQVMTGIKQGIRPLVSFLTLCMDASGADAAPAPGERLDYPTLLKTLTDNPSLVERLREFGHMGKEFTAGDGTPRGMLDKVFQQMQKAGYIAPYNKDQEAWVFTGKVDYLFQIIDFMVENEPGIKEANPEEDSSQGELL